MAGSRVVQESLEPEFDFWDYVSCALCHLPFTPSDKGPPPVPFWLTECGHVLCNNHLNPDQSCAACGDQSIQLVPLQRDLDPSLSDWFRSLPHAMDSIAHAVKFQQQSLAALVRHYRKQCLQLSATCDRLRNERRSLRKEVDALRHEATQVRRYANSTPGHSQEPSAYPNSNGKRPLTEARGQSVSGKTSSSPRSATTPIAPLRLTLPPGDSSNSSRQDNGSSAQQRLHSVSERPGSSRFAEKYIYHGREDSQMHVPQMTYAQSAPLRHSRMAGDGVPNTMLPPATPQPSRFKPATEHIQHSVPGDFPPGSNRLDLREQRIPATSRSGMRPPPTPRRPFSRVPQISQGSAPLLQSNRFQPGSTQGASDSESVAPQGMSTRFSEGDSAGNRPSGGQRMAFVPGNTNGHR